MEDKYQDMPEQASGESNQPAVISEQEFVKEPVAQDAAKQTEEIDISDAYEPIDEQELARRKLAEQESAAQELAQKAQQAFDREQEQKQEQAEAQAAEQEVYQYRWNYEEQRKADVKAASDKKRSGNRGVWIYAGIMTAVFAFCFCLLIGVLIYDALNPPEVGDTILQGGFAGNVTVIGGGDEQTIEMSALESVRNYTVVITAQTDEGTSTGTGIVLTQDGYIVTNYHVIEDAHTIKVKFYNGQAMVAEVIGFSEIDDIAVIKINATGLYYASLGSSSEVVDSQNVYAVGTPAGEEYAWSVTKGVVSYGQRDVKIYDDEGILVKKMKLIQTDTPVNPGNSGGPLVNSDGEVLGIITMKLSGQYENMGFAIPIDGAMVLINNIIETGEPGESPITTKRPLIGIVGVGVQAGTYYADMGDSISSDPADLEKYPDRVFYAPHTGVLVKETTPGLDAANKLQVGDIIVMADGQELVSIYDLMAVINEHNGGETVEITYYRNGVANVVEVELGYAE